MAERRNPKLTTEKHEEGTISLSDIEDPLGLTETVKSLIDNINSNSPVTIRDLHRPHPDLLPTISHLSQPLFKLVSLTTGKPHPYCPDSVLRYHLLTSHQLDGIARHYHQIWPPVPETYRYPKPITPWVGTEEEDTIAIEVKRERIGQFIGLRREVVSFNASTAAATTSTVESVVSRRDSGVSFSGDIPNEEEDDDGVEDMDTEEDFVRVICREIRNQMQQDWEDALERARRDEGYSGVIRLTKT